MAGHLIECSAYVTGGYYSAFKDLIKAGKHVNLGFPIASVNHRGECVLSKEGNTGGMVTVDSVSSQLLYEIQGKELMGKPLPRPRYSLTLLRFGL